MTIPQQKNIVNSSTSMLPTKKVKYRRTRKLENPNAIIGPRNNDIYQSFAEIDPKKGYLNFRVCDKVDKDELSSLFKPRQIVSIMALFSELRHFSNYLIQYKKRNPSCFVRIPIGTITYKFTLLGKEFKPTLNKLIELGYLEFDSSYKVGERTCGYRLGERFSGGKWENVDFEQFLKENLPQIDWLGPQSFKYLQLWNRFNYYCQSINNMPEGWMKELCEKQMKLNESLTLVGGEDLANAVKKQASAKFAKSVEVAAKSRKKRKFWEQSQIEEHYWDSINAINLSMAWVKPHHTGYKNGTNRIYSSVASLPRDIRPFLRFEDKKLVSVDIRACQVALLASFYELGDEEEKAEFIDTLFKKDIYVAISKNTNLSRDDAKEAMFKIMFGQLNLHRGEIYDEFSRLFPVLAERIVEKKKKDGYKSVSKQMQTFEARVMIQGALQELIMVRDLPAFSIHDSILCLKEDVSLTKEIIIRHFTEIMGFAPVLKVD